MNSFTNGSNQLNSSTTIHSNITPPNFMTTLVTNLANGVTNYIEDIPIDTLNHNSSITNSHEGNNFSQTNGISPNFFILILSIIPLLTIFGNLMVITAVYREKILHTVTNYLIVSLAISDFLVALCVMTTSIYFEIKLEAMNFGKILCNLYISFDVIVSTASILNLLAISLDRYIAISRPVDYCQYGSKGKRAFKSIAIVWVVSICVGLPILFGVNNLQDSGDSCEFTNAYFIIGSSVLSFFVPCLTMIALYTIIFKRLRQREKAKSLRYSKNGTVERDHISTALLSGAQFAHQMGKHFKKKADQILLETSSFPSISSGSSSNDDIQSMTSQPSDMEKCLNNVVPVSIMRTQSDLIKSFGDEFLDCIPYIDSNGNRDETIVEDISGQMLSILCRKQDTQIDHFNFDRKGLSITSRNPLKNRPQDDQKVKRCISCLPVNENCTVLTSDSNYTKDCCTKYEDIKKITEYLSLQGEVSSGDFYCNNIFQKPKNSINQSFSHTTLYKKKNSANETPFDLHRRNAIFYGMYSFNDFTSANNSRFLHPSQFQTARSCLDLTEYCKRDRKHSKLRNVDWSKSLKVYQNVLVKKMRNGWKSKQIRHHVKRANKQMKREHKATITLAVVLVVFLACWLPFFTIHFTDAICMLSSKGTPCVHEMARFSTTWLGYLNSSLNPLIYTVFDQRFRRAFRNIIHCKP